jgi:hypothetical protein
MTTKSSFWDNKCKYLPKRAIFGGRSIKLLPRVPESGVKVTVQIPGKRVKKAMLLPEETTLPIKNSPVAVTIEIPTVELFRMLAVDYQ